ncbi:thiamine biosynthesis lipoprotein [Neorhizobium galegae]|uniref:FAD:protein FMN transferase n=1 Tax=Neorhizobium galegae TaxID=399 RepID=UPI001AE857D6|nr:FAD:protein FMN transferase [Neorhizobium galegae]MBP2562379.1 thiamine biosynthesis lipoprotein [Neorhizobium galegae]MDQ0138153.1 thiamine biosynthesis lipoprotein [Neorhizobium galegae]
MPITRRRLITISAAFAMLPAAAHASMRTSRLWTGQALGARASIRIDHPDGEAISRRVMAEINRLEDILSLYRPNSSLATLNREGQLASPPFELLECMSLAGGVHAATGGRFDPTIQPLWALWAEAAAQGKRPEARAIEQARRNVGWHMVELDVAGITLKHGMALSLNGVGQGYVADRVAALLEAEGLNNILIDTGELRALGGQPEGGGWPVFLKTGEALKLRQRALASSAPLGTTFDDGGKYGHILDPATGMPTLVGWDTVSISAPSAAVADALATAACLMPNAGSIEAMLTGFAGARLEGSV